jgi:hypothetical protein
MVGKPLLAKGLRRILKGFPGGKLRKGTLTLYGEVLADLEPGDFEQAVEQTILEYDGIWPSVARIRGYALAIAQERWERERIRQVRVDSVDRGNPDDPRIIDARAALRAMLGSIGTGGAREAESQGGTEP